MMWASGAIPPALCALDHHVTTHCHKFRFFVNDCYWLAIIITRSCIYCFALNGLIVTKREAREGMADLHPAFDPFYGRDVVNSCHPLVGVGSDVFTLGGLGHVHQSQISLLTCVCAHIHNELIIGFFDMRAVHGAHCGGIGDV